jgi:undecaprenyl-diphosphatase
MNDWISAIILGAIEGFTEFLPISSTGHLILAGDLLGFQDNTGKVFEVVIQLGAILAVVVFSFGRLWQVLVGLPSDPAARRFAAAVILAFLPAAVLGAIFHDFIKSVLFSPWVVCVSLVVGGIAILLIERMAPRPRYRSVDSIPMRTALGIGFCQALAMIPGVSRAGATILGATVLDLYKARHDLTSEGLGLIAIGFVTAFVVAIPVVKGLIDFVGRYGLTPFAWYRIVFGLGFAAWLYFGA